MYGLDVFFVQPTRTDFWSAQEAVRNPVPLAIFGIDHHSASVALREQLAFQESELVSTLQQLKAAAGLTEAVILSTCNRVEITTMADDVAAVRERTLQFLSEWHAVPRPYFEPYVQTWYEREAIAHIMRVASGLESLVPGEKQILGQVKRATLAARDADMSGPVLTGLYDRALSCGRRVRTETEIARHPVSISHAAVRLAEDRLGSLQGRRFLLLGSGKMGTVTAKLLHSAGASHFIVANRTAERARRLAVQYEGTPITLDELPARLAEVDVVISSTAAPHAILEHGHFTDEVLAARNGAPLLLIDLAVPRDVEPAVGQLPNVSIVDIDGLQEVVEQSMALRNGERADAVAIVAEEVDSFVEWYRARRVAPTITAIRKTAEGIRQAEVEQALRRFDSLSEHEQEIIEMLSHRIVNKLLHEPTIRLREKAAEDEDELYSRIAEELFGVNGDGTYNGAG